MRNQRTGCAGQGVVNRAVVNHSYVRLLSCHGQVTNAVLLQLLDFEVEVKKPIVLYSGLMIASIALFNSVPWSTEHGKRNKSILTLERMGKWASFLKLLLFFYLRKTMRFIVDLHKGAIRKRKKSSCYLYNDHNGSI